MSSVAVPSSSGFSAIFRLLLLLAGILGMGGLLGAVASVQQPARGLAAGFGLALTFLAILLFNQTRSILRALGATRQPYSPSLTESWRRAAHRLAAVESAEAGGRRVKPRQSLPRLAVFDHAGPMVLALRGWTSRDRWLVVSRDLLERFEEEAVLQAMMEGVRALDRREAACRTALSASATLLCRGIPLHLLDGPEPARWTGTIFGLVSALACLPVYSFLAGTDLAELGSGAIPRRLRPFGVPAGGSRKKSMRRQLRRAKGHLPAHLAALALWHSGGSRNVLSAVVETR